MKYFTLFFRVKYCDTALDSFHSHVLIKLKVHKHLFWNIWYQID